MIVWSYKFSALLFVKKPQTGILFLDKCEMKYEAIVGISHLCTCQQKMDYFTIKGNYFL